MNNSKEGEMNFKQNNNSAPLNNVQISQEDLQKRAKAKAEFNDNLQKAEDFFVPKEVQALFNANLPKKLEEPGFDLKNQQEPSLEKEPQISNTSLKEDLFDDKASFAIPSKEEFKIENAQSDNLVKEPHFEIQDESFANKMPTVESSIKAFEGGKLENPAKKNLDNKDLNSFKPISNSNKKAKLNLEDTFVKEELEEDPDKIPVKPTLTDDEVPNKPGAILMHARELLGLSIREVADKLQLRVNTVNDIEHDRLNQPTAVSFVSVHIGNYARLVNIDAQTLIDLYIRNVEETVQVSKYQNKHIKKKIKPSYVVSILALASFGAIAYGLYSFVGSDSQTQELSQGELVLNTPKAPKYVQEGTLEGTEDIDSDMSNQGVEEPLDVNTLRAQEQAQALERSGEILETSAPSENVNVPQSEEPLTIQGGVKGESPKVEIDSGNQFASQKRVDNDVLTVNDNSNFDDNPYVAKSTALNKHEPKVLEINTGSDIKANEEAKEVLKEEVKEEVKLSNSLRDISSSAKVSGREGLASMNNVQISVKDRVALKVIDSRGHVLKSGTFKAGDSVSVSGIPPLKIQVSDSSKIKIRYMGGTVKVPSSKQVSFSLPTR